MSIQDIYNSYITRECALDTDYMLRQPKINFKMRKILIEWLYDVCISCDYDIPTVLPSAIWIFDKYLEKKCIDRHRLQLLGIVSLRLAIKYELREVLTVDYITYVSDNAYKDVNEILEMEFDILKTLDYNISFINSNMILITLLECDNADETTINFASQLLVKLLPYKQLMGYKPSIVACAILFLTKEQLDIHPIWTYKLRTLTKQMPRKLRYCLQDIQGLVDYQDIKVKLGIIKKNITNI